MPVVAPAGIAIDVEYLVSVVVDVFVVVVSAVVVFEFVVIVVDALEVAGLLDVF